MPSQIENKQINVKDGSFAQKKCEGLQSKTDNGHVQNNVVYKEKYPAETALSFSSGVLCKIFLTRVLKINRIRQKIQKILHGICKMLNVFVDRLRLEIPFLFYVYRFSAAAGTFTLLFYKGLEESELCFCSFL